MKALDVVLVSVNAALYAVVGYATYLGLFAPVVGTVRFWPSVVIPAAFAVVFGPKIGGLGAAIGIFISDMLIHGNAFLSLTVGVPSNFIGFYLIGVLSSPRSGERLRFMIAMALQFVYLAVVAYMQAIGLLPAAVAYVFIAVCVVSMVIIVAAFKAWKRYLGFMAAGSIGLTVGSLIIGVGLWAFSQFQPLPSGDARVPLSSIAVWFAWTYLTEAPFLYLLTPPLIEAMKKAFGGD